MTETAPDLVMSLAAQELAGKLVTLSLRRGAFGLTRDDLMSAANCGLCRAAKGFDSGRGVPFTVYAAKHIKGEIATCIAETAEFVLAHSAGLEHDPAWPDDVSDEDPPKPVITWHSKTNRDETVGSVIREHVLKILDREGGDKARAAVLLGVSLKTLYNWLNRWETFACVGDKC